MANRVAPVKKNFTLSMPSWLDDFLPSRAWDFSSPSGKMEFAIALSRENMRYGTGGPFGTAIFDMETDELVSCGVNRVEPEGISSAHAEIMALCLAEKKLGGYDLGPSRLELVTSSQPCTMCIGAIIWAGVRSVLVGARREDVESLAGFEEGPILADWVAECSMRGISVTMDVLRDEACAILMAYRASGYSVYNSTANWLRLG